MPDNPDTTAFDDLRTTLRGAADRSYVVALGTTALAPVRQTASRLAAFTRESYIYRWLTTEPDPEVVVIDLRETYTVGPIITVLDALFDRVSAFNQWLAPYWDGSTLNQLFDWSSQQLHRAVATRAGRVIRSVLEPPEPPDGEDRD